MKWFWLCVLALVLVSGGLWIARSGPKSGATQTETQTRAPAQGAATEAPPKPSETGKAETAKSDSSLGEAAQSVSEAKGDAGNMPAPPQLDLDAMLLGESGPSKAVQAAAEAPHATSAPTTPPASAGAPGNPKLGPMKIEAQPDGSVKVDGRFTVRGKGTPEEPYEIPWSFLTSAQETYQPRLGMKNLPDRLNMVNNKYVTITGYIAFPVLAETPDEMLMMLNQWDGCCIGVPPTPYDAVEVKLSSSATREQRLAIDGTVTGVLKVDPYLVKDWLVSMYVMSDARLVKDSASGPNKHLRDPNAHMNGGGPGGAG
ncbi:MAG TPA: hypothetical protein PL072_12685, partial [Phycisphaerales bacterium]|nr:hypothetical protein [Phycisphaerales bacterium]